MKPGFVPTGLKRLCQSISMSLSVSLSVSLLMSAGLPLALVSAMPASAASLEDIIPWRSATIRNWPLLTPVTWPAAKY